MKYNDAKVWMLHYVEFLQIGLQLNNRCQILIILVNKFGGW